MNNVPAFKQYFASEDTMTPEQRQFYATWLKSWKKDQPLDVQGNISYLFCYVYDVLSRSPKQAIQELSRLIEAYPVEEKFSEYCQAWRSDCHVLLGNCRRALDVYPPIPITSRAATCTDDVLSLKVQVGEHISGRDILTLNGPRVTKWGKAHLDEIARYLGIVVPAYEANNDVNLLKHWSRTAHKYPYSVFRGTASSREARIPCYSFSTNGEAVSFITEMTRDAENSVRDECNIPRIGEGWVSETALFYELKKALPSSTVVHHAHPEWLGRQHLDVLISDLSVAVEFQGVQHNQPVEYFGGERAFRATRRRDAKKKRLCTKHGIHLIYVRPGYVLQEVIAEILSYK